MYTICLYIYMYINYIYIYIHVNTYVICTYMYTKYYDFDKLWHH